MKFLCVSCNQQMKLLETRSSDQEGSLSVVFGCPGCSTEICMMTNPAETQVVGSLGVRLGNGTSEPSKCPFSGVVSQLESTGTVGSGLEWTEEAHQRLQNIPEFVRPMAREGIEGFARSQGYRQIDVRVLEEAREKFGM
jgi:hypothetical protein